MIIYKGKRAVCGIQLTIDRVLRYAMTDQDTLTVRITDDEHQTVTKTYTSEDVDSVDKQITVELSPEDTSQLSLGRGIITAYMNELCVLPPTEIFIKEAL
jgi:hypothetical protein